MPTVFRSSPALLAPPHRARVALVCPSEKWETAVVPTMPYLHLTLAVVSCILIMHLLNIIVFFYFLILIIYYFFFFLQKS